MKIVKICRYLKLKNSKFTCEYMDEAIDSLKRREASNYIRGCSTMRVTIEPNCPLNALRNKEGMNVCYIIGGDEDER